MTRAWQFAEDGDWKDAADYFNRVLDIDPLYAPAFFGLLCVELKVSNADELANTKNLNCITKHKYYKRAIADSTIKAQLSGYIRTINGCIAAEQKRTPKIGGLYYFAGYDWRVLDIKNNKMLLISEKILEDRPYHQTRSNKTWELSTLRKYLNGEFYDKLGEAKSAIVETNNNNQKNQWYDTVGGNVTNDKVFLLSLDELVKYFGDSGDLSNKRRKDYKGNNQSDGYCFYDSYNNARIAKYGGEASMWWLRSPGRFSTTAAYVSHYGSVFVTGCRVNEDCIVVDKGINVKTGYAGVRPALWLNLQSEIL
jgi:hypothetical protein